MTKQEILDLVKECKDLGLKSIEIDGHKFEFHDNIPTTKEIKEDSSELTYEQLISKPSPYDELTDEEILFWSTDYGQELAEQRKTQKQEELERKRAVQENDLYK